MKVAVGSDHAGFEHPPFIKPAIIEHVEKRGHEVVDCGTWGPDAVDYPDIAAKVCEAVLAGQAECGVLVCGTGMGVGMAANRYKGIRAAVCVTPAMARLGREHNHANVLCIGGRILSIEECLALVDIFLDTPFSAAERHQRRLAKMG